MTDETPLDRAHAAMEAAPEDDALRLAFFGRLAEAELVILLAVEAEGDDIAPDLFTVEEGQYALVFDSHERLAAFVGRAAPSAAMPGRVLVQMLAGHDIGLALNPEVAPSAMLIAPEGVDWLAETLAVSAQAMSGRARAFVPPEDVPDMLIAALDARLARAAGLAASAWLAGAEWDGGARGLVLAYVGALPEAEAALAGTVAEALAFSGLGAGWLDVMFLPPDSVAAQAVARVGLGFDLTPGAPPAPAAPGMDPDRPPKLR